jgi:hypothetical protein
VTNIVENIQEEPVNVGFKTVELSPEKLDFIALYMSRVHIFYSRGKSVLSL